MQNIGISQNHRNEHGLNCVDELNSLIGLPGDIWHVEKLSSPESTIESTSNKAVVPSKKDKKPMLER